MSQEALGSTLPMGTKGHCTWRYEAQLYEGVMTTLLLTFIAAAAGRRLSAIRGSPEG